VTRLGLAAWVAGAVAGLGLLLLLPVPGDRIFWRVLFDSAHAPLFAFLAIGAPRLVRGPAAAGALVAGLALLTEAAQIPLPRDASLADVGRNLIGVAAGLLLARARSGRDRPALRRASAIVAVALLGATFVPLAVTALAYRTRARIFPRLVALDARDAARFVEVEGAEARYGDGQATVTFLPGGVEFPRLQIVELEGDWRGFRDLAFRVTNPSDATVRLNVRVHDAHASAYRDRYNGELDVAPGEHDLTIPLREIEEGPEGRALYLGAVRGLVFFLVRPARTTRLVFADIRLEGSP
jgi:hypothetical protein